MPHIYFVRAPAPVPPVRRIVLDLSVEEASELESFLYYGRRPLSFENLNKIYYPLRDTMVQGGLPVSQFDDES